MDKIKNRQKYSFKALLLAVFCRQFNSYLFVMAL